MSMLKTSFGNMSDLSVHQVVNSDDIMSEILLMLPPETVYKLIIVSKRWLQIISNPFFRRTYVTKWKRMSKPVGFFTCKTKNSSRFKYELRRPSYSLPSLRYPSSRTSFDDEIKSLKQLGHYIDSSNGFILCISHPNNPNDYSLWNPSTTQCTRIPHPNVHFEISCTSLMIIEDRPFSYKVIRAEWVNKPSAELKVETFSSKTNTWLYSELTCPEPMMLILGSQGGGRKLIGGVVYWYATGGRVAIYDTDSYDKQIDLVKLPKIYDYDERVLAGSADGCLQYGRRSKSVMEIWKLEKVGGGVFKWKHQHKLNFNVSWRRDVDPRFDTKLLAFPVRNEAAAASRTCSSSAITEMLKGSKKKKKLSSSKEEEEEQGVPYGMYCHSFDGFGFPSFLSYKKRADVLVILGKKLLRHYMYF